MKPVDYRNENWASIQDRLQGQRKEVLAAWRAHGPGTTQEVAERSQISILSFRPRTTELYQIGLVVLADEEVANAGSYRAASEDEAKRLFEARHATAVEADFRLTA
jgi:hypothetical protein